MLSSQIYHESGEKFDEGIKRNEGMFVHILRHLYLVGALVAGVKATIKVY